MEVFSTIDILLTYCFYLLILTVSILIAFCIQKSENLSFEYFCRISLLLVLLIPAACRLNIGRDYNDYVKIFNNPNKHSGIEPLFLAIIRFCKLCRLGSFWMFGITSFFTYLPLSFFIPKKKTFMTFTFYSLLFCYMASFNLVRQSCALSYLICGCLWYFDKRKLKAFIFFLIACGFHYSSILIFPCLIIYRFPIKKNIIRICLLLIGTGILIKFNFISIVFKIVGLFSSKYAAYGTNAFLGAKPKLGSGLGVILNLLMPIYFLFMGEKLPKDYKGILNLNVIYMLSYVLALQVNIFSRLQTSLLYVPIICSTSFLMVDSKYKKVTYYFFCLIYLIYFIKNMTVSRVGTISNAIVPYINILGF